MSIDSFPYYGTDQYHLTCLGRYVRPGGAIGIAGAGLMRETEGAVPDSLQRRWDPSLWSLPTATWWQRHWVRTGIVDVELADSMPDGCQLWLHWQHVIAPDNHAERQAVAADQGSYLGYVHAIGRRRFNVLLHEPITSVAAEYLPHPLQRRVIDR